jgi:hypothetical protein
MLKNYGYGAALGLLVFLALGLSGFHPDGVDMVLIIAGCAGLVGSALTLCTQLARQTA